MDYHINILPIIFDTLNKPISFDYVMSSCQIDDIDCTKKRNRNHYN